MLFYKFQMTCELKIDKGVGEPKRAFKIQLSDLSAALAEGIDGDRVKVLIHRARQNLFQMLVAVDGLKNFFPTAKISASKISRSTACKR